MGGDLIAFSPRNVERTGVRDLSYSRWHRKIDGIAMIDIDSVETCKLCRLPIAVIELARDVGQNIYGKKHRVTTYIAKNCGIPSYVVFYRPVEGEEIIDRFRVIRVSPDVTSEFVVSSEGWENHLRGIHSIHERDTCPSTAVDKRAA